VINTKHTPLTAHNTTTPQHHNTTTPQHHNTTTQQHNNQTMHRLEFAMNPKLSLNLNVGDSFPPRCTYFGPILFVGTGNDG
jgi:hypothetical protein